MTRGSDFKRDRIAIRDGSNVTATFLQTDIKVYPRKRRKRREQMRNEDAYDAFGTDLHGRRCFPASRPGGIRQPRAYDAVLTTTGA